MSWFINAIFDQTPWWLWLIVVAAVLAATYQFWAPLWALLPKPLKLALGALFAVLLAFMAGRNRGAAGALERERAAQEAARQRAITTRKETDDDVGALGHADVDQRLSRWMRGNDG